MIDLLALVLFGLTLTLVVLGAAQFYRTRTRAALWFVGAGAFFLFAFLFLASRFALQLLGVLLIPVNLPQFATQNVLPLAVGVVGIIAAVGIFRLAQKRLEAALGVTALGALALLVAVAWLGQQLTGELPEHPGIAQITLPEKFRIQAFASDLQEPNALAFDEAGNLYYSELVDGNIVRLRDTNGDGIADEKKVFASNFANPRGLVWHNRMLYVSSRGQINTLRDTDGDGVADENKVILDKLFSLDIQHSNNGVAFGPDGKLYIAIGGPRVGQLELKDDTYWYEGQPRDEWRFAGILQVDADGGNPKLWARGLRNPYALAFDTQGNLYATDNGDETIPIPDGDELNLVEQGVDYGYPYFFGLPPAWSKTRAPLIAFAPHTAPTGLTMYNAPAGAAAFPASFQNTLFIALYWRGPAGWYREVVSVAPKTENGIKSWEMREFVTGLDRPVAVAVGPDGALYIADMRGGKADPDEPGAIYRVSYSP